MSNSVEAPNISQEGLTFVISAPAGTGKTTLANMLVEEFDRVKRCVTCTTRKPRKEEVHGKDYFFLTEEEFRLMAKKREFLEYVNLFEYSYGTPKQWIADQKKQGYHVLLVIDVQGAMNLRDKIDAVYVFLSPPTKDELRLRLNKRAMDTQEEIELRLSQAEKEMQEALHYDYQIINRDLHTAYQVLRSILIAEEHKIKNKK